MGSWTPEDELLFTLQELPEGSHSLLYDPVVSEEASSLMIDLARSASIPTLKFGRTGYSEDNESLSGKRKPESVSSCYHASGKRIRDETFNSVDLSFDIASNDGNYGGIQDVEHIPGNCMLGNPIPGNLAVQGTNMNILQYSSLSQMLAEDIPSTCCDGSATDGFHTTIGKQDDEGSAAEAFNIHKEIPHILEENHFLFEGGSGIEELHRPKELPVHGLFEANNLTVKSPSTFDQLNNNSENICSEFEGNHHQVFNSVECGLPSWRTDESLLVSSGIFDQMINNSEYVCSQFQGNHVFNSVECGLPTWETDERLLASLGTFDRMNNNSENICSQFEGNQFFNWPNVECGLSTDEGFASAAIPADYGLGEIDLHKGDMCALLSDNVGTNSTLESETPCMEGANQIADTAKQLLDLDEIRKAIMNNEPFFKDPNANKKIGNSNFGDLSSLWPSLLNNGDQDQMPDVADEVVILETQENLSSACSSYTGEVALSCPVDGPVSRNSGVLMLSSASTSASQFAELTNGIICCTLNTEDPEIPCNDDVVFPEQPCPLVVSSTPQSLEGGSNALSTQKDFPWGKKTNERDSLRMQRDKSDPGHSGRYSQIKETGRLHPISDGSAKINPKNTAEAEGTPLPLALPKEKSKEIMLGKPQSHSSVASFIEKPAPSSERHNSYQPVNSSAIRWEVDAAEVVSLDVVSPESVVHHPRPGDLEGSPIEAESDDDVHYLSGTETTIFDKDLIRDDQNLGHQKIASNQNEDAKGTIRRLEQGLNSYMQRAIARHGAFAVLFNSDSKYYINKPETVIGRTAADFAVDFDLGGNEVSRWQAIIGMEEDGSFHLKNLGNGESWILISSKEVARGQSQALNSDCLVEISGESFIFLTNESCVKQYLNTVARN